MRFWAQRVNGLLGWDDGIDVGCVKKERGKGNFVKFWGSEG